MANEKLPWAVAEYLRRIPLEQIELYLLQEHHLVLVLEEEYRDLQEEASKELERVRFGPFRRLVLALKRRLFSHAEEET